ncbi:MAG: hypothetical protein KDK08_09310 [Rhizobiaceae bacterium]|nr:hypothetical protein [Rhizobiaceae bacterium]
MPKESRVRDRSGTITHIDVTSDDGSRTTRHEYDKSWLSHLTGDYRGKGVEVTDHHKDGTSTAYDYDDGFAARLTHDHRGSKK